MRVLFVTRASPWPANHGGAMRSMALIRALAVRHEVTLTSPILPERRQEAERGLSPWVREFLWVEPIHAGSPLLPRRTSPVQSALDRAGDLLAHPLSPLESRFASPEWARLLSRNLASFDAVLCRYQRSLDLARSFPRDRVVLDMDDLRFVHFGQVARNDGESRNQRLVSLAESFRAFAAEQLAVRRLARTLVCSAPDATWFPAGRVSLVPNGIDLEPDSPRRDADPDTVLFLSHFGWPPNQDGLRWFMAEVWPRVRAGRPSTSLLIVGLHATPDELPFAAGPGVTFAADVPETRSWIERAVLSVVPLRIGAGTRIKILESLGYGTPVVATSVGARGLAPALGEQHGLYLEDQPADMARRIEEILAAPDPALRAAAAGRGVVRAEFSWEAATRNLAQQLEVWVG